MMAWCLVSVVLLVIFLVRVLIIFIKKKSIKYNKRYAINNKSEHKLKKELDMSEGILNRIKELEMAVEHSVGQHNALIGRLNEAKYLLEMIAPQTAPVIEGAIAAGEAVLDAVGETHAAC